MAPNGAIGLLTLSAQLAKVFLLGLDRYVTLPDLAQNFPLDLESQFI